MNTIAQISRGALGSHMTHTKAGGNTQTGSAQFAMALVRTRCCPLTSSLHSRSLRGSSNEQPYKERRQGTATTYGSLWVVRSNAMSCLASEHCRHECGWCWVIQTQSLGAHRLDPDHEYAASNMEACSAESLLAQCCACALSLTL